MSLLKRRLAVLKTYINTKALSYELQYGHLMLSCNECVTEVKNACLKLGMEPGNIRYDLRLDGERPESKE